MASGNAGKVALAKIGSLYTDTNSVNTWMGFTDENLEHKLDELEEGALTGRRDAPNSYKGLDHGAGDVNYEPNPNAVGHMLNAWFGTLSSSVVTAASSGYSGQYIHRFTPTQTPFSDRTFLAPYNFAVYRDINSAFIFKGTIFPSLKFVIKAKELVKATATLMSRKVDLLDYTAGMNSLVSGGGRPWIWDMASIEYSTDTTSANLAANAEFEEMNISFDLPHEGIPLLDGTKNYAEFVPSDFRRIKIDGTMSFRSESMYLAFKNYEQHRMRVSLLNVNTALFQGTIADSADASSFINYPGLRFHFPAVKFTAWSAPVKGPNRIIANFSAKAEYLDAAGFSAAVDLLNTTPNSVYTTAIGT